MTRHVCQYPDQRVADIIAEWPETIAVFMRHRMLCVGCVIGPFHTVQEVCAEYHLDPDAFCAELSLAVTKARRHLS